MQVSAALLAGLLAVFSFGAAADPMAAKASLSESRGTRAEAVAMVRLVQARFKEDGAQKTFAAISDKSNKAFHQGDLYPFVFTFSGTCVAHGASPALIGKNLIGLTDPDGKFLIKDLATLSQKGEGWYDYKWPNPITKLIENKTSFYSKLGTKYFVGVGVYRVAE